MTALAVAFLTGVVVGCIAMIVVAVFGGAALVALVWELWKAGARTFLNGE